MFLGAGGSGTVVDRMQKLLSERGQGEITWCAGAVGSHGWESEGRENQPSVSFIPELLWERVAQICFWKLRLKPVTVTALEPAAASFHISAAFGPEEASPSHFLWAPCWCFSSLRCFLVTIQALQKQLCFLKR